MRINSSARKHDERDRLRDDDVLHAAQHPLYTAPLDDEDNPRRWLILGLDGAMRPIELVMLVFDDGGELIIHAMKMRERYYALLV